MSQQEIYSIRFSQIFASSSQILPYFLSALLLMSTKGSFYHIVQEYFAVTITTSFYIKS